MEISKSFSINLLLLIVTLIQFNDCRVQNFPSNFDKFSTAPGTRFHSTGSKKYAKIYCFESLILKAKKLYDPANPNPTYNKIQNELNIFQTELERAYSNSSSREGRSFNTLTSIIKQMCSAIDELPTLNDLDSFIAETYEDMMDEFIAYDSIITEEFIDSFTELFRSFPSDGRSIFPGTLWCGAGNSATSDDQLGFFSKEDSCCRKHDKCPFNISANKKFGRLINKGSFTKSACFCDREFYQCLKDVNSIIADKIGYFYFTVLSPQCIGYEHPITGCKKNGRKNYLYNKCIEPTVDTSKPKKLQWFNNFDYK